MFRRLANSNPYSNSHTHSDPYPYPNTNPCRYSHSLVVSIVNHLRSVSNPYLVFNERNKLYCIRRMDRDEGGERLTSSRPDRNHLVHTYVYRSRRELFCRSIGLGDYSDSHPHSG
jgi:hypothetical protein